MPRGTTPSGTRGFSVRCSIRAYFWRHHSSRLRLSPWRTHPRILIARWRRRTNRCRPFHPIRRLNPIKENREMSEGIELPESHHEDHPLGLPVSITISIMAVVVAGVSLLGHRAPTQGLRLETQPASRWTQDHATIIRLPETHDISDVALLVI